jgi:D-3-phosphoglycerate dehydrogenase
LMTKKILITPKLFKNYKDKAYSLLKSKGYAIIDNTLGRTMTEQEIVDRAAQEVVGIIVGLDPLPAVVLNQCKNLKAISRFGVGMDNIDLERAKELGIRVRNAAGTNSISVAELAIGLMFSAARMIPSIVLKVKKGSWEWFSGCELTGKKLGLIGGGQIGKEVAKRARGLEMEVVIYDPYFTDESFLAQYHIKRCHDIIEIFSHSDFISLHVPVTQETRKIINHQSLQAMKPNSIIINTSRGELVDEVALYEALSKGIIAAAAQDVFSSEPPSATEKLLKLDNFILTSHIGTCTHEAVEKMVKVSTENLLEMLEEKVDSD